MALESIGEPIGEFALITAVLLNPAEHRTYSKAAFEIFHEQEVQIGKSTALIICVRIFGIKTNTIIHVKRHTAGRPNSGICKSWNERPAIHSIIRETPASLIVAGGSPNSHAECNVFQLADVI